ncbi:MAG TPA: glycosyltransferase family 2 protein [Gemmatimonadaceae bacterium]|nr:glycosyltransferase family 2 protein [Gemmatimonadaceae bacterium]
MTEPHPSLKVSILVPVYNEQATIADAIDRIRSLPIDMEIICVDDCSTDGTRSTLSSLEAQGAIDALVLHDTNRGKGAAVRSALARAAGDVVVIQDADLEYDPNDLQRLLGPIEDGRADAVFGSRFKGDVARVLYYWHSLGNWGLTTLSNMLTNLNISDMETCYKMVRTDLMKSLPLTSDRFGFEPELTARLAQSRARIYEVPISYSGRTYAEGKKIRWTDGLAAFWHIIRFNLFSPKAPVYRREVKAIHPSSQSFSKARSSSESAAPALPR